jgi:ATP-binding cassette subfamily F protein 3
MFHATPAPLMSLITVTNLSKSFGPSDIFKDVSFSIPYRARMAMVGPNGIGKTTLLRILAGEETPSSGLVSRARGVRLGYLPQESVFESAGTLWDECLEAFALLRQMEDELRQLERRMSDPAQAEAALERYGPLQAEFDHGGGYTYIARIQQVLGGLGFTADEFHLPLNHLSGGQRTRALLARLLLSNPDLLILDEPTNHLDIQAVEWLENYLAQWEGAVLIVSHDRYFMDRVASLILELSRGGLESYRGNYTAYLTQRQMRWEERIKNYEAEKERLEKEVEYIKKNIAGQNVLQAKGRLRRLSRYLEAVDQLGLEAVMGKKWGELSEAVSTSVSMLNVDEAVRRVRSLPPPRGRPTVLHLKLKPEGRSGEIVLRAHDLQVGYPDKPLFDVGSLELMRLECAALIGPNGAGKTTFLKTILEQIPPLAGKVQLGASLKIGYFAQAHEGLQPERTLVEEIDSVAPEMLVADIRDYLARFQFSGEDVFKRVGMLSGGERGRLALAKLALSNANLLLLDEPTNHLDIPSQEILQDVLAEFPGTILLVSHDRYLIDALATQVWEIDEEHSRLRIFKGDYSEYHQVLEAEREAEKALLVQQRQQAQPKDRPAPRGTNEERRRQRRIQELEAQIGKLEEQLRLLASHLENPPADAGKVQKLASDYNRTHSEVEALMGEWEKLHEL